MSKKSRRRNKKILAALALAGGAAMLGRRRRNTAIDKGIASAQDDKGSDMLYSERVPDRVKNILAAPKKKKVETTRPSIFETRFSKADETISKGERARKIAADAARNKAANYYKSQTHDARPIQSPTSRSTDPNLGTALQIKNQIENQKAKQAAGALSAGNQLPGSMKGGAETAQGFVRKVPISRTGRGKSAVQMGWTTQPYKKSIFGGLYSKGGRVKLAKRGLGRAFTKSKK